MTMWDRSELATHTANRMQRFADDFAKSYTMLIHGDAFTADMPKPHRVVAMALDADGGIVCPYLDALIDGAPTAIDLPALDLIVRGMEKIYDFARDVATRLKLAARSGASYVKRFFIQPRRVFSIGFFDLQDASGRLSRRRERIIAHICKAVRAFLDWLRRALCQLEDIVTADDPMRPIALGAYASRVVLCADRPHGLFVLQGDAHEGALPFHIRPGSQRAWNTLRLLCEATQPDGYVSLPSNYASAFHNTDRNNETIHDDYERLVRHIVPGPEKGRYRLEREAKRPLLRGA